MNFQFLQVCVYSNFKLQEPTACDLFHIVPSKFNNPIPHWGKADFGLRKGG